MAGSQDFPTATVAQRVRELRRKRGLSAEKLAAQMQEVGVPFDKTVIANLETGRRRYVSVQELFALAYVLDVAPVHLLVPPDAPDRAPYRVLPNVEPVDGPGWVRAWIRGNQPIRRDANGVIDPRRYDAERPLRDSWIPHLTHSRKPGDGGSPLFPHWLTDRPGENGDDDAGR